MVEGETLLVLLLLGRCQHPRTAPQPAKKGAAAAMHDGRCPDEGADVMVEGETLLVLLLLGRCQHPTTAPQPAKKGAAAAMHRGWCPG